MSFAYLYALMKTLKTLATRALESLVWYIARHPIKPHRVHHVLIEYLISAGKYFKHGERLL